MQLQEKKLLDIRAPRSPRKAWTGTQTLDKRIACPDHSFMVLLADSVIQTIVSAIRSRRPAERIMLFGSRARGDASPSSDIDIAIIDPSWTRRDIDEVHARLEEDVRTALKIDLLALHLVQNEDLRTRVLREGIVIHE